MKKMLLIVDPQVDFITGTLPVPGAAKAMDALAEYVRAHGEDYSVKVVTSDWHPYHHSSFVPEGGQWPRHCVQHSAGAALWQLMVFKCFIKAIPLIERNIPFCRIKGRQDFF